MKKQVGLKAKIRWERLGEGDQKTVLKETSLFVCFKMTFKSTDTYLLLFSMCILVGGVPLPSDPILHFLVHTLLEHLLIPLN